MNIEQIEADLPNGFHDAILRNFSSTTASMERRWSIRAQSTPMGKSKSWTL